MSNKQEISDTELRSALRLWTEYLLKELSTGTDLTGLELLIGPQSRDRAWIYHGGSGNRSLFFLLDDQIQIRFDLDLKDKLVAFAVFPKSKIWIKAPGGILLQGGDGSEYELHFL
ncbi:MAG: hypothetical protein R2824_25450 [Saprospiraceae bacterium]|nr:hypothetical protein [Lewinella sp.]